jgi:NAD-dependent SIR2 family protein deacetylase
MYGSQSLQHSIFVHSYDNLQKYNLPFPEAVFDLHFYRRNPKPFLSLAKEIWPGLSHSPTLTHSFVALLSQKGFLLRNYSQNIDGLEVLASIPFQEIVECHGHFRSASCIECRRPASDDYERIILETNDFPTCKHCGGYVKPDIVFFGEGLPDRFSRWLDRDLDEADLLLIMGTSLMVAPVSMIPNMVNDTCKRVLLNRERVGDLCDEERDVIHEGDCDDSVRTIARLLNWEQELLELNASTRIKETKREVE